MNGLRGGLPPLVLSDGVTAAAQALAEAMANASDWQPDFDFGPHLQAEWDVWRFVTARWTTRDPGDPATVRLLSDVLLGMPAYGSASVTCELCTHLGVGVATAHGRTYATALVAGRAPADAVIAAAEAEMADLVNGLRAGLGLRALTYDADIAAIARRWSETMGAEERLYHNPDYWRQYPTGARSGAENVSRITAPLSLRAAVRDAFDGLVDSPSHYANMVNPGYTHLGVGLALDNGSLWVTQNFAQYAPGARTTAGTPLATATGSTSGSNGAGTPPDTSTGPAPEEPDNQRPSAVQRRPLALTAT
ncbi:MAG: CAP domain-containing protein [Acidimicrobiia bacterium]|nr:CAP domain-containing protein [Acidimicrobiia bacterium]